MYSTDVKELIEKKKNVKFSVSKGPVSAIADFDEYEDEMVLVLFGGAIAILFDRVETTDCCGIDLYYNGNCVAAINVSEWSVC